MRKTTRWFAPVAVLVGVLAFASAGAAKRSTVSTKTQPAAGVPASLVQLVKQGMSVTKTWNGPTRGPIAKKGKFVVSIPCARVAYGCARIDDGVKAAAKVLGWKVLSIDPKGDPSKANEAVRQAIQLKADGIVVGAIDPVLLKESIAAARKAGIPIIDPVAARLPSPTGINHDVKIQGFREGQVLGAYVAVASKGTARVGIMDDKEFPHQALRTGGIKNSLAKCSGCKIVGQSNFVVTDIGTQLGPKSQAFLQANPSINWLDVAFDAATGDVVNAMQQAGARKANVVSMDGNPQNLDFIQAGTQAATVAAPLDQTGWAAVDNINRIISGQPPVANDGIPIRLVTKANLADFRKHGFGPVNYKVKYTQLWKTGKTTK